MEGKAIPSIAFTNQEFESLKTLINDVVGQYCEQIHHGTI
jgi:hypothetical protein